MGIEFKFRTKEIKKKRKTRWLILISDLTTSSGSLSRIDTIMTYALKWKDITASKTSIRSNKTLEMYEMEY